MEASKKEKLNRKQRRDRERQLRRSGAVGAHAASQPRTLAPSLSLPSPAADREQQIDALEACDSHAGLRNKLRTIAKARGCWAGIPMPLEGEALIVEPRYPNAKALMAMCAGKPEPDDMEGCTVRNQWHSMQRRCDIILFNRPDGSVDWGLLPAFHSVDFLLRTLGCSEAWGVEQESNAINLLGTLVDHRKFKSYLLTGMLLERSKRSGVFYLFRRLRPTVAIVDTGKGKTKILCALCMHPIAYYRGSWAGAMTPTDDVIAHLTLMRGDERLFWKRSTQHPAWRPEAGL